MELADTATEVHAPVHSTGRGSRRTRIGVSAIKLWPCTSRLTSLRTTRRKLSLYTAEESRLRPERNGSHVASACGSSPRTLPAQWIREEVTIDLQSSDVANACFREARSSRAAAAIHCRKSLTGTRARCSSIASPCTPLDFDAPSRCHIRLSQ